jgi:hypothetical protein
MGDSMVGFLPRTAYGTMPKSLWNTQTAANIADKKKPEYRCPTQYRTSQEQTAIFANKLPFCSTIF